MALITEVKMGHKEHKNSAPKSVNCYILTVSDTRTPETDESGKLIKELLINSSHKITGYKICKDDCDLLHSLLINILSSEETEAVIINGGTGIGERDITIEVIKKLFDKELTGFGEIFRYLSYLEIGASAIMSRASAGVAKNKIIISLPGSKGAVTLGMNKLILPELGHMIREIKSIKCSC